MCCAVQSGRPRVSAEGGEERCAGTRRRLHRSSVTSLALPEARRGPGWVFFQVWRVPGSVVGEHVASLPCDQPFSFEGAQCFLSPKSGVSFGLALSADSGWSVAELVAFPRQCLARVWTTKGYGTLSRPSTSFSLLGQHSHFFHFSVPSPHTWSWLV